MASSYSLSSDSLCTHSTFQEEVDCLSTFVRWSLNPFSSEPECNTNITQWYLGFARRSISNPTDPFSELAGWVCPALLTLLRRNSIQLILFCISQNPTWQFFSQRAFQFIHKQHCRGPPSKCNHRPQKPEGKHQDLRKSVGWFMMTVMWLIMIMTVKTQNGGMEFPRR